MKKYRVNRLYNGHSLYIRDPYNPYDLPDYTLRLKYENGKSPSISKGTSTRVSTSPNIWDVTYEDPNWDSWLANNFHLTDVLGGNTTNVTSMTKLFENDRVLTSVNIFDTSNVKDMSYMYFLVRNLTSVPVYDTSNATTMDCMFYYCSALTAIPQFNTNNVISVRYTFGNCSALKSIPLFDTSNVITMEDMCYGCSSLTSIPLFNTNKVTNMIEAFEGCGNVKSGALALYQQASTQATPPRYHSSTFRGCGINTQTGSAELAQIPSDWK